jgi:hypothetical protein
MSVGLSTWNNLDPNEQIFMKFDICTHKKKYGKKIQVSLKLDKNNRYFTWRPIYIFDHISHSSS